jgi:FkbM family methyltransferase
MPTQAERALDRNQAIADWPRVVRLLRQPLKLGWMRLYRHFSRVPPRMVRARLFTGQTMRVVLPEPVSRELYLCGYYEPGLTREIVRYLRPGMIFADVGAHFGYYSMVASGLVGPRGRVFAFEPTPSTYELLQRNIGRLSQARAENAAVYSASGVATFHDFGLFRSACNSLLAQARVADEERQLLRAQRYDIRTVTLDEYFGERGVSPDFVKIDAESVEFQILHGMKRLLATRAPMLSIENGDFNVAGAVSTRACVAYLAGFGYRCFQVTDKELKLVGREDLSEPRFIPGNLVFVKQ